MSSYQGMRWLKCDLQVQTPEDGRHWDAQDTALRLIGSPRERDEQDLQEKARKYLQRCHEVGLEVIGVTDHNFCGHREHRKRFLTHLIEQNRAVATEVGRDPLWIFPGFEVDIGYHLLCLFPPEVSNSKRLDDVCDALSALGLTSQNRFDSSGPVPLRRDGRDVSLAEVLRIVQNERGGIVIAAHASQKDGIASDARWASDFRNEDLLCVEIASFPLGGRDKSILESAQEPWVRSRPPAYILSSDAKSTLADESGQPKANSLGYRSTWIKMSEPSIEALRQAFLDWGSRIRLEGDPRIVEHDRIRSLEVERVAFLEDQTVAFSPGLNCLIGGRGSGKSSLFEYIRFALRREDAETAGDQVGRIRKTLTPDSVLRLSWRERDDSLGAPGPEDVFEYRASAGRSQVTSRNVTDASTIFNSLGISMFSQREITRVADSPGLLQLIDNLIGEPLKALRQEETECIEAIKRLQILEESLARQQAEVASLEQEVEDLERRWAARSAVQEEQKRHRAAQEALRYLTGITDRTSSLVGELDRWGTDLVESHSPLGSIVKTWPESGFLETLDAEVERAKQALAGDLRQAAKRYETRIQELTGPSPVEQAAMQAEREFREACSRQGLRPEDLDQLFQLDQQRKAKVLDLESKRRRAAETRTAAKGLEERRSKLQELWREQTRIRKDEISRILQSAAIPRIPGPGGDRPTLEVRIRFQANREDFFQTWSRLAPDARTRAGRQWDELGDRIFSNFLKDELGSPWQVVQAWLDGSPDFPGGTDVRTSLQEQLLVKNKALWDATKLIRIQDDVDLALYRSDGTEAGSLRQNQLSDGQRNTAILMLLLASGNGPILIDQPEDELDSGFIFQQLVPLFREVKNQRQVIVVTHNPNLPVNADAELIYALQAKAVEGTARGVVLAQGGLDRETVKEAVLEIMEGSEEAFRKRREKYHF